MRFWILREKKHQPSRGFIVEFSRDFYLIPCVRNKSEFAVHCICDPLTRVSIQYLKSSKNPSTIAGVALGIVVRFLSLLSILVRNHCKHRGGVFSKWLLGFVGRQKIAHPQTNEPTAQRGHNRQAPTTLPSSVFSNVRTGGRTERGGNLEIKKLFVHLPTKKHACD